MTTTIDKVIDGGYCVGCGACTAITPQFEIRENASRHLSVSSRPAQRSLRTEASKVCPFASAPTEDQIATREFGSGTSYIDGIGHYNFLFAGHSNEMREIGGSGGISRWLTGQLLDRKLVDYVVVVAGKTVSDSLTEPLFSFDIFDSKEAYVAGASKSAYYPITLNTAIERIREREGSCMITALPCFSRAIRALCERDPDIKRRIKFIFGVICGGLKSKRYAEYLAVQMGISPKDLSQIDFRNKSLSETAKDKCVEARSRGGHRAVEMDKNLRGTNYALSYFKPKACDYCDDVMAETADAAFGDAWIPRYSKNRKGTNVVVVRNPALKRLIVAGIAQGELVGDEISSDEVLFSQGGGLRHRRQGLQTRLAAKRAMGRWAPEKRVDPEWGSAERIQVQGKRVLIRKISNLPFWKPENPTYSGVMRILEYALRKTDYLARIVSRDSR